MLTLNLHNQELEKNKSLYAIVSAHKAYHLIWLIEKDLNLGFVRNDDLVCEQINSKSFHIRYCANVKTDGYDINIIQNYGQNGLLYKGNNRVDFLLILKFDDDKPEILKLFNALNFIQLCFSITFDALNENSRRLLNTL